MGVAYAKRTVDENGNMTGVFVQNQPAVGDPTGARLMWSGTAKGVYKINCDGTGTVTRTVTSTLGVVTFPVDDFIVTKAIVKRKKLVATEILDDCGLGKVAVASVEDDVSILFGRCARRLEQRALR